MTIFVRYVVGEIIKVFLSALLVMTAIMTVAFAVNEGIRKGLPPALILQSMPFILPQMLGFTIPGGMLFAVNSVFGRMAGTNEIVALKSLGISPLAVVWPVVLLSLFLSVATVWFYDLSAAWCRPQLRRFLVESVEEIAYGMLRAERSFRSPQFSITVKRVEGRKLIQPTITLPARGDTPAITLWGEEAELISDHETGTLMFRCRRGEVDVAGRGRAAFPDRVEQAIPFDAPKQKIHRDWLTLAQIPACVALLKENVALLEAQRAERAPPETPSEAESRQGARNNLLKIQAEPHRRISSGFSCLCFVMLGAPVAMRSRRIDFLTSFFACFLPILLIYYPLLIIGEKLATSGALHPGIIWIGNAILIGLGVLLMRKVVRY